MKIFKNYNIKKLLTIDIYKVVMSIIFILMFATVEASGSNCKDIFIEFKHNNLTKLAEQAIVQDNETYIPLSVVKQVSRFKILHEDNKLKLFIPHFRANNDVFFIDDYTKGVYIDIPIKIINKKEYLNLSRLNNAFGVLSKEYNNKIVLETKYGLLETSKTKPIQENIAMVFDPFSAIGEKYKDELKLENYKVISPSWFELDSKEIVKNRISDDEYVNKYHQNNIKIWPLITNQFDPEMTHEILTHRANWQNIASYLAAYAMIYNFDGYNFDFENIKYEDQKNLTEFVKFLSNYLKNYGLQISMDVTIISNSKNWSLVYDRENLNKYVDYFIIMAYDQFASNSTTPGPVASLSWVENGIKTSAEIIPPEKIILGIPFYSRLWTKDKKDKNNIFKAKTMPLNKIDDYLESHKLKYNFDKKYELNYITFNDKNNEYKMWFDDYKSLNNKLALIKKYKLKGFAAWRKGFENNELWSKLVY